MNRPALFAVALTGMASATSCVPQAAAGDFATLNTLGFSADGAVFAFEQHGVQDGSGFPYSEIFFLDLDEDRFIAPSPIRVRLEEDGASVETARAEARKAASALFERFHPESRPGVVVADNPATELSADPYRLRFSPRAIEPSPDKPVELRLTTFPISATPTCEAFGPILAYRLVRIATEPGDTARLIHEDAAIPDSRNCPLDYGIARVIVHSSTSGRMSAVAVIGVKSVGFEGPDLRFIANAVPLD